MMRSPSSDTPSANGLANPLGGASGVLPWPDSQRYVQPITTLASGVMSYGSPLNGAAASPPDDVQTRSGLRMMTLEPSPETPVANPAVARTSRPVARVQRNGFWFGPSPVHPTTVEPSSDTANPRLNVAPGPKPSDTNSAARA